MQFRLLFLLAVLALVSIRSDLYAQYYRGGSGNGAARVEIIPSTCTPSENTSIYFGGDANGAGVLRHVPGSCSAPENVSIYFGGDANGGGVLRHVPAPCTTPENLNIFSGGASGMFAARKMSCTPSESSDIYFGGIANGADAPRIANCPLADATLVNIFIGGAAEGFSTSALAQAPCSTPENLNIFMGGDADGCDGKTLVQAPCAPLVNQSIFFGGDANGDALGALTQKTCDPVENLNIFTGGRTAGYVGVLLVQKTCTSVENLSIFFGGASDGYVGADLMQAICSQPENIDIFTGGDADGYGAGLLAATPCMTPENVNIFVGGNADGYTGYVLSQTSCPTPENVNIFMGGDADGYMGATLSQKVCDVPENTNIFAGGAADGFAPGYIISCTHPEVVNIYFGGTANGGAADYITMCPVATPINFYTGGDANGGALLQHIPFACTPPQNLSIYFGGVDNGGEALRYIKNACPTPENQNIYLGGDANGADLQLFIKGACTPPENLNIYLGTVGNGAAYVIDRPTVCLLPENQNIFFGGRADGYDGKLLVQPYYWTGAEDHNWHNPNNWSTYMVPDLSALAIIPNVANDPVISDGPASAKGIVLRAGATLDVSDKDVTVANAIDSEGDISISGSPTVTVGGNLTCNAGSFASGSSTVVLNGDSSVQEVALNVGDFYDLKVSTTSGASAKLIGAVGIRGNLSISSGELDGGSSTISLKGNWSNFGVFTPSTSTVSFGGTYQTVDAASAETFYNVRVGAATQLAINNDASVASELTMLGGDIITGINTLTVGRSAALPGAISYTAGRVVGRLERWMAATGTYLFPIGSPSRMYTISLEATAGVTPGSVVAYFVNSNPGVGGLPLTDGSIPVEKTFTEGFWNLTAQHGFAVGSYNVAVRAEGFSSYTLSGSTRLLRRTNSGGWKLDGAHLDAVAPVVNRTGLTGGVSPLGTQLAVAPASCSGGQILDNFSICTTSAVPPFANQTAAVGGASSFSYTWQYSDNLSATPGDGSWVDVPSSNLLGYDVGATIPNSRLYVRKADGVGCPTPVYSNAVKVAVYPLPKTGAVYHIANNIAK